MTDPERLDAAFREVRRVDFLPREQHGFAGEDTALPIGHGQTNSQPSTVRAMLDLLDVHPGQRVLDVGCGSASTTALLGRLVGPAGEVVGVEIVPELVAWGGPARRGRRAGGAGAGSDDRRTADTGRSRGHRGRLVLVRAAARAHPRDGVTRPADRRPAPVRD
jgi:protein-L-isoaspartate(D-aspartate) O-methyltransferase